MSVLVNGMKMPANCQNCFASDDECRFCRAAKKYIPMLGKPKFCPLVALPDHHGRLGDLDALIHELNNSHYPGAPYVDAGISITIGKICDAHTIVEAEDSE